MNQLRKRSRKKMHRRDIPFYLSTVSRIITGIFLASMVLQLTLLGLYTYHRYQNALGILANAMEASTRLAEKDINEALDLHDKSNLKSVLRKLIGQPAIYGAQLRSRTMGTIFAKKGEYPLPEVLVTDHSVPPAIQTDGSYFWMTFPLSEAYGSKGKRNTLTLFTKRSLILEIIKKGLPMTLLQMSILALVSWGIFLWLGRRLLTRPLMRLANKASKITLEQVETTHFEVHRGDNEMNAMADGFNTMLNNLRLSRDKHEELTRHLQEEGRSLTDYNQNLETEVADRTAELREQNRQLHEALDAAKDAHFRVEDASKSKSTLLAGLSHEIRTPLAAIMGMSESLTDTNLDDEQRKIIEVFRQAGEDLLQLTDNILDLSMAASGKLEVARESFNIIELVEQVVEQLDKRGRTKGVTITSRIAPEIPPQVLGDRKKIRQILSNLISNAIRNTSKGSITVNVRLDSETQLGSTISFSISDSGASVPTTKNKGIFHPFGPQEEPDGSTLREGSGLGLSICRTLVQLMNGDLWLESGLDTGNTYHFTIEFGHSTMQPPAVATASQANKLVGRSILVVDDSEYNRFVVETYLQRIGCTLTFAENGHRGVQLAQSRPFDAIIMDIQMPGMDGYETTRIIRSEDGPNQETPIIAMTAFASDEDAKLALDAGCNLHLAKPVKRESVLMALEQTIS